MSEDQRRRLGRGLSALLGDPDGEEAPTPTRVERSVPIESLVPNRFNPRRSFDETALAELAESIRERGIVQPLLVRPERDGVWEIIAGERRWRAAQRVPLHEVPVVVRDVGDTEALELAIVENVQRADLNAVEEARGYRRLIEEFGYRQDDLAKVIGKSRSHVANTLRLLNLPETALARLAAGEISAGHARTLLASEDPDALAERIVSEGLSVRAAEAAVGADAASAGRRRKGGRKSTGGRDADVVAFEKRLSDTLGLSVRIEHDESGKGRLTIGYGSLEQLEDVCRRLEG